MIPEKTGSRDRYTLKPSAGSGSPVNGTLVLRVTRETVSPGYSHSASRPGAGPPQSSPGLQHGGGASDIINA